MRDHVIAELVELSKEDNSIMLATADLGFNVVEKILVKNILIDILMLELLNKI